MSSLALEVASSIAELDPTGIAPKIFSIVSKINEQYEQMQGNKEVCQGLKKELDMVGAIVAKLSETKQIGPCQRTLIELNECLIQCLTLIGSIGAEKDTLGKIKAFLSAKGNQEVITKLTTQLHSISDILNLALTAQTANSVEKMVALMAEKEAENLPSIQRCKSQINEGVDRLRQEIQTITITNMGGQGGSASANVYVQVPQSPSSAIHRSSISLLEKLRDLKEKSQNEQDKFVLRELSQLFMDNRGEKIADRKHEKTGNFTIYNEVLERHNASLGYDSTDGVHILYVDYEPVSHRKEVLKKIKGMIDTLCQPAIEHVPSAQTTALQSTPLRREPEQKHSFERNMLTQYANVNTSDLKELKEFLKLVAEGEQDKAEAILNSNPALALVPGDVTDLSKRTFTCITGFQYAVWALDWHMWTMIRKYLPDEVAREQAKDFEMGSWVKSHGVNAQHLLEKLINALQTTIDLCAQSKWTYGNKAWIEQVGEAQFLLPAHVVNEYCHPTRSFDPCPNFRNASALPRTRRLGASDWFTPVYGTLAINPVCRAKYHGLLKADGLFENSVTGLVGGFGRFVISGLRNNPASRVPAIVISIQDASCDRDSVRALTSTRTAQREELISELRSKNVQVQNPH